MEVEFSNFVLIVPYAPLNDGEEAVLQEEPTDHESIIHFPQFQSMKKVYEIEYLNYTFVYDKYK